VSRLDLGRAAVIALTVASLAGGAGADGPRRDLVLVPSGSVAALGDRVVEVHDYGDLNLVELVADLPLAVANRSHHVDDSGVVGLRGWQAPAPRSVDDGAWTSGIVILDLVGPLDRRWRCELEASGVEILAAAADHALVVRVDRAALGRTLELRTSTGAAVVVGAMPLPVEARVERSLAAVLTGGEVVEDLEVRVAPWPGGSVPLVVKSLTDPGGVLRLAPRDLALLLRDHPGVAYLEPVWRPELHANLAARTGLMAVEPVWLALGVTGDGVVIAHNDGGVDLGHSDLAGAVVATIGDMAYRDTAHGTHTAGAIVGRGVTGSPSNPSGCGDLTTPLPNVRGMAWGARLATNNIFSGGLEGVADMMAWGVRQGAWLSSNSWGLVDQGRPVTGYTAAAVEADAAVRDADPAAPGEQALSLFFSVGNSGPEAGTVTSPATAKNVISIGSVENDRCGAWVPGRQPGPDPTVVVTNSGRGPSQGRIKPDLVAPGSDVLSLESADPYAVQHWDQSWTGPALALNTGTSQACALAAGAGGVLHELVWRTRGRRPSPELIRAALVDGADDDGRAPSVDVGWGRLDLVRTVSGPAGGETTWLDRDETAELAAGAAWETPIVVRSPAVPLRVTLAWTDVPGEADAAHPLVNDLDLIVTAPDGTAYRGNLLDEGWSRPDPGAGRDADNNIEVVRVAAPDPGDWTVRVVAVDVPVAPPGLAGQDFALVVSGNAGRCQLTPAAPSWLTAAAAGDRRIELEWSAVPGATRYRVGRARTAGGWPYLPLAEVDGAVTAFVDTDVSGGIEYFYVVSAFAGCWSTPSNEASATATGPCTEPPLFGGLDSVTDLHGTTCSVELGWAPARSQCGVATDYDVYRSSVAGFTPVPADRVATGVGGDRWVDAGLEPGADVFYIVRARDAVGATDDGNLVERSGRASGPDDRFLDEDAEGPDDGFLRGTGSAADAGTALWTIAEDHVWDGLRAFFVADEDRVKDQVMVTASWIELPPDAAPVLEFHHRYRLERGRDGGRLEVSTNGGRDWFDIVDGDGQSVAADPGRWLDGGPTDTIASPTNPIFLERAWTGDSTGWIRSRADLAAFAGLRLRLRWRFAGDDTAGLGGGWWVDRIRLTVERPCQTCIGPPPPDGLSALASGAGVELSWPPVAGAASYHVARSTDPDGPFWPLATVQPPETGLTDSDASGGSTYFYVLSVDDGCRSAPSAAVTVVAGGPCRLPPVFWGLDEVVDRREPGCALDLAWRPATPGCAGADVRYRVYGSPTEGFVPGPDSLLAEAVAGPRYRDTTVDDGTTRFYRARAVDGISGAEESNPVEHHGWTTGPDELLLFDSVEGGGSEWETAVGSGADSGTEPWRIVDDLAFDGRRSWFCADESRVKDQVVGLLEAFAVADEDTVLAFSHLYDLEPFYDGGRLEYSTDGGVTWHDILDGDGAGVAPDPTRFLRGGYSGFVSVGTGHPFGGEAAWTGFDGGWTRSEVSLAAFVGRTVRFRWRLGCDRSDARSGWWLDAVELRTTATCQPITAPAPRPAGGRRP
jgi:hypothetical protein